MTFIMGETPRRQVTCMNGYRMSVQASGMHYCKPRRDNAYAYEEVECAFEEPDNPGPAWDAIQEFRDGPDGWVYGYVPIQLVLDLIQENGGMRSGDMPPSPACYDSYRKDWPSHPAPYEKRGPFGERKGPEFTHDCEECKYYGRVTLDGICESKDRWGGSQCDAYVCPVGTGSVIARYGNDGPAYLSMPGDVAKKRAKAYLDDPLSSAPGSLFYVEVLRRADMLDELRDDEETDVANWL